MYLYWLYFFFIAFNFRLGLHTLVRDWHMSLKHLIIESLSDYSILLSDLVLRTESDSIIELTTKVLGQYSLARPSKRDS